MERDIKRQADDGMAKEKIREASCNRGEEDMIEIAKTWSLRQSNEAVCETTTQNRKQNDLQVKERTDGSKSEIHLCTREIHPLTQADQVNIMLGHQSKNKKMKYGPEFENYQSRHGRR